MIWGLVIAVAVICGLVGWPLAAERLRKPVDFSKAPGQLAALSQGITHYRWFGPDGGPVVVCVHGQSTPSDAYLAIADGLAADGYRVLIYDIYGRGYSSDSSAPQTLDFLLRQLDDLLHDQDVTGRFTIMGYSMGGLIAPAYASRHPDRIDRIALFVPAGFWEQAPAFIKSLSRFPRFANWIYAVRGASELEKGIRASMGEKVDVAGIHDIQLAQLQRRGFRYSVSSAFQSSSFWGSNEADHRVIRDAGLPLLVVWADKDDVIPASNADIARKWNPASHNEFVPDAGHGLPYTHAKTVVDLFRAFVRQTSKAT